MKKARLTETQIVNILKFANSGMKIVEICRQNGIRDATLHNWKSKNDGMEVNDVKRLKELGDENRRLKNLFSKVSLENHATKVFFTQKGL